MADILPTVLFPGFVQIASAAAAPADGLFIPMTALPDLTLAEANEVTGDGREVLRNLLKVSTENIDALAAAAKPTKLTVNIARPQGIGADEVRQAYTCNFDTTITGSEMVSES